MAADRRRRAQVLLAVTICSLAQVLSGVALAANERELVQLLEQRRCPGCRLQDADLVFADLRDADLRQALLQRANLGRARLDGANLQGADLRFTSLRGASLRGANLRGAFLEGVDLRQADVSGALFDPGALANAHWDQVIGLETSRALSYAELHNAGVRAAQQSRYPEAERFFAEAINKQPLAAVSWLARAITRVELGKTVQAADDFGYAGKLYAEAGELELAADLKRSAERLREPPKAPKGGNGKGIEATAAALAAFKYLAPIAAKAFVPLPF